MGFPFFGDIPAGGRFISNTTSRKSGRERKKEKEEENNPTSYDLNKMQLRMMERKEAFGMLWGESLGYKNTFHHQSRDMREEDSVS
jgi:hypothetical protein